MDKDIKSQIERAKELLNELKKSCNSDIATKSISGKTKNLTQEVLTKMRHTLDQCMYKFFEKIIAPTLSETEKREAKIYFPITKKHAGLKSILGRGKMANLETKHSEIYKFLEAIQPYNTDFQWLDDFSRFANEKHIRLTPQELNEKNETILSNTVRVSGDKVKMKGCLINGIPINSENINATPLNQFDPRLQAKRKTWISFNFKESNINIIWLCNKAVYDLEKVIDDFFTKF